MTAPDMIRLGLENLLRTRLRTVLTILGVVVGIGALASMVSFGTGMQKNVTEAFRDSDLFTSFFVTAGDVATVGGGQQNDATGAVATIAGGRCNKVDGVFGTIGGGGVFSDPFCAQGNRVTDHGPSFSDSTNSRLVTKSGYCKHIATSSSTCT